VSKLNPAQGLWATLSVRLGVIGREITENFDKYLREGGRRRGIPEKVFTAYQFKGDTRAPPNRVENCRKKDRKLVFGAAATTLQENTTKSRT